MLHVVCLKWGTKYPVEYVNKLYGMVKRNLSQPFSFHCLTEDPTGIRPEVNVLPLPDLGLHGWWYKLYLFKQDFYGLKGQMLFLDLDVVISGSLDDLINHDPGHFYAAHDCKPGTVNSSVLRFEIGSMPWIWESFWAQQETVASMLHGDQDWIYRVVPTIKEFPFPYVVSYRNHCKARAPIAGGIIGRWLRMFGLFRPYKKAVLPEGARVVLFFGKPDPVDVQDGPYDKYRHAPWVGQLWQC